MFKLIKILNSGVNVPEPCRLTKDSDTAIKMGAALVLSSGAAAYCGENEAPEFISMEDAEAGKSYVTAFQVTEGMLFEAAVSTDPAALYVGAGVALAKDTDGATTVLGAESASGIAKIVSLDGAAEIGDRITVKF